ncbi:cell surface glycoprotein [Schizosaccharomyces osmophilus]|uniref:Cell surface glycoprotein n=1 Tax=Schizosaccharomyces osmophilus TaxID=2545709 RepID=A0AAE9WA16_9SCHI|nr:cell surface glycoprotein [Schizosaccharomyces osmophilus]WBW72040.1 cell surface glycoprotein [Schizosaccharomyces osmophilus]
MGEESQMQGENLLAHDEYLYTNEYGIPPPRQENVTELSRYLNDLRNALNEKNYFFQRHELEQSLERIALRNREMNVQNEEYERTVIHFTNNMRALEQLRAIESRLNHYRNEEETNNSQPPQWFVNFLNDPNGGFLSLKQGVGSLRQEVGSIRQEVVLMEQRQNLRFDGIDQKLNKQEYRYYRLHNIQMRSLGKSIDIVPYLNGQLPDIDLPRIYSIEDIERLTKDQCTRYLNGYGIRFGPNETIKLKERIRDAVGLHSVTDAEFRFSGFH